jgi:2-amino-4-hydroxy-6-hydroxymethyldihydropteridine diphosphokinase
MPDAAMASSARVRAGLGLGGNVGDAAGHVRAALAALGALPQTRLLKASSLYRTKPWGVTEQPDFINACALVETGLAAQALLDHCLAIERGMGRDRAASTRWGPRRIDIDLLFHGDTVSDAPGLQLPHPRMFERGFVLAPLAEIDPDMMVAGRRIGDALAALGAPDWTRLQG